MRARTTIRNTLRRSLLALTVAMLAVVATTGPAAAAGHASPAAMSPCPQSGQRVKGSSSTIYLVDPQGYYDVIPDEHVYFNLWGSWSGITTVSDVTLANCEKAPLPMTGAYLVEDFISHKVYIFDGTIGSYRWIVSLAIFNKYKFDMSRRVSQNFAPAPIGPDWNN